ncbi:MAG: type 1 glutamine amidotransferase [Leptothrix sp. (in: b-proteobacteria)]
MSCEPLRVLIVQPQCADGPSYLATFLRQRGIAFELCSVEAGDEVPVQAHAFDAIAMLGGSMSVNDTLPFLHRAELLLRDAIARGVPVLGHCLGGQLLARALGAEVTDNPVPEIGWSRIQRVEHPLARAWLGEAAELPVYQWHSQTFALPDGATLLAGNRACAHQAFAFGPHLGMQFHIEVDAEKLHRWAAEAPAPGDLLLTHPSVQDEPTMRADTARQLAQSQRTAAGIYARWLAQGTQGPGRPAK